MTLATSGTMSLAGTATDRSIQVELSGNGTTQMSINDTVVRALGEQTVAGSAINMSTDFYGKSAGGSAPAQYLPVSLSGTDSATDSSIPALIPPIDNVQITGTTYWRRVRLTSSQAGSFRLYCNPVRTSTTVNMWRSDMQTNMLIVTQSGTETEVPQLVGTTGAANWERSFPGTFATQPNIWSNVTTTATDSGNFYQKTSDGPTPSSQTGRLQNFISTSTGFGFFETTSMSVDVPLYLWLRSPQYTLAVGDTIDFYYGVDCAGLSSINFYLAA
tara:strand:+ start:44 stop:862 length:819 start_codon:yes stop_codon:yes gene_type:complete